ncbi:MAG TPA: hypothetical protein VL098_07060 [Flavipsychrobacter sp.]|nr:hypothetical protein [Flavipsychrobacter sp.]
MKKYLFLPLLLVVGSCCNKAECIFPVSESVTVNLTGFTTDELADSRLLLVSEDFSRTEDSMPLSFATHFLVRPTTFSTENYLRDQNLIIRTAAGADTLYGMNCTVREVKENCNNCFLKKDNQTHTEISDFSLMHKNKSYQAADTLFIRR